MLNAIIIDDKRSNIETLQQLVLQFCPSVTISGTCTSIDDGYALINKVRPDLVFLDVELSDEETGFELLKMFKSVFFKTIFTTAHSQYAVTAFRENAVDYLLKPVNIRELQVAVSKVEEALHNNGNKGATENIFAAAKICLPTQEGYLFVNNDEILYCEASGSYTNFYFVNGKKMLISMHLKECENILPPHICCRIHNSYIVNMNYVTKYVRGRVSSIVLNDDIHLEVSPSRKAHFLKLIGKV